MEYYELLDDIVNQNFNKCLKKAERKLYSRDLGLIISDNNAISHHAAERSIVFRFGHYLAEVISTNDVLSCFNLDCEYNLDIDGNKNREGRFLYPDLIMHKRKTNSYNFAVIECKGWWSERAGIEETKDKIRFFLCSERYSYRYGLLLIFNQGEAEYNWIE